jgi:hypothetical protein
MAIGEVMNNMPGDSKTLFSSRVIFSAIRFTIIALNMKKIIIKIFDHAISIANGFIQFSGWEVNPNNFSGIFHTAKKIYSIGR